MLSVQEMGVRIEVDDKGLGGWHLRCQPANNLSDRTALGRNKPGARACAMRYLKGGLPGDFVFLLLSSTADMANRKERVTQLARGRSWRSSTSTAAYATSRWRQISRSCESSASRSASPAT